MKFEWISNEGLIPPRSITTGWSHSVSLNPSKFVLICEISLLRNRDSTKIIFTPNTKTHRGASTLSRVVIIFNRDAPIFTYFNRDASAMGERGQGVGEKRTSEGSTLIGVGVLDRRCASDATSIGPVQREERRFKGSPIMCSAGRSL